MRKRNFHIILIILFIIVLLGISKYFLPSVAPTSVSGRAGKQTGSSMDMGSSSNSISFFSSEASYGIAEDSDYEAIANEKSAPILSSHSSSNGSSGFHSNNNLHANRFEENSDTEPYASSTMSSTSGSSSDEGIGIAMVSVSITLPIQEKKDKDEKSEKGELANSKTNTAGKTSFFRGNDQIMATPPPPPTTPTQAPLDDYYPLIAIAGAIFGTSKLLRKSKVALV